jgi:hypothetical protein
MFRFRTPRRSGGGDADRFSQSLFSRTFFTSPDSPGLGGRFGRSVALPELPTPAFGFLASGLLSLGDPATCLLQGVPMSTATASTPIKQEKAIEPVVQAAPVASPVAIPATQPEEPPLLRDWAALLIWLGGAAILVLMHLSDLVEWLFHR